MLPDSTAQRPEAIVTQWQSYYTYFSIITHTLSLIPGFITPLIEWMWSQVTPSDVINQLITLCVMCVKGLREIKRLQRHVYCSTCLLLHNRTYSVLHIHTWLSTWNLATSTQTWLTTHNISSKWYFLTSLVLTNLEHRNLLVKNYLGPVPPQTHMQWVSRRAVCIMQCVSRSVYHKVLQQETAPPISQKWEKITSISISSFWELAQLKAGDKVTWLKPTILPVESLK